MIGFILAQYLILVIVSTLLGAKLNQRFKLNLHPHLNILIGFITLLSIFYFVSILWILLRLSTNSFYLFMSQLLLVLIVYSLLNVKEYHYSSFKFYGFGLLIVVVLMALTFRYSFGIRSFDGAVYLSSILDNINAPFLNAYSPYDGSLLKLINVENDYQSYYHLNSYLLWIFTNIQTTLKLEYYQSLSSVYLVSMTAFYFTLLYHLVIGTIHSVIIKSKLVFSFILIYLFLYFTSIYFNSSLAFLGQAYRTLIIGFMTLIVYLNIKNEINDRESISILSISAFAAISTSSSAYFIVFIVLYAWLYIKIQTINKSDFIQYCIIASIPILSFVILYLFSNSPYVLNILGLMIIVGGLIYRFSKYFIDLNPVVRIIIPLIITFVSIGLVLFKGGSITHIFTSASAYDMVWDYFSFDSFTQLFRNILLWFTLIVLITKGNKTLRNYYLVIIIVFINPLNFVFLSELLAGRVVHRVFDVLFNPVSLILMFSTALPLLNLWFKRGILVLLVLVCIQAQTEVYHFVFIRPENSSYLERISNNEIDVLNILNTKIILEKLDRPKVVSQIHTVKAYVKNITLSLSYRTYRKLKVYEEVVDAPSELWNIFVYREYESMRIFKQKPDYANTCKYLIDERVNFVLVARNQFYRENNDYIPLYFRVRDCASLIYENDDYLLYQFYW